MPNEALFQLLYQHETLYSIPTTSAIASLPSAATPVAAEVLLSAPQPPPAVVAVLQADTPPTARSIPTINHQVLILVNEQPAQFEADKIYLSKILEAVGSQLENVDLMNIYGSGLLDFRAALNHRKAHHFISFGVPFLDVNLDILMNLYDPKRIKGVNFLFAEPLATIQPDAARRRALWNALKQMFEIK
jgi:hypothetical protein